MSRLQTAVSLEGTTKYFYYTDTDGAASQTGKGQLARSEYVPSAAGTSSKNFYTYQYWDDAKQLTIKTQASNQSAPGWAPGASQLSYDVNGFLTDAYDVAGGRTLHYTNSATGLVVRRDETVDNKTYQHFYYYAAGKRIGDVSTDPNDKYRKSYAEELAIDLKNQPSTKDRFKNFHPVTSADFDQNYEPINSNYPAATASSYTVRAGDTLASIAQSLWGDSSMWYMLADANALKSTDSLAAGRVLVVPNKVTNIHNNANTFRPYNAGEMIGHVDPTLPAPPPPPGGGCGGFGMILMVVVAVVATIYTAGALSGATAGFMNVMSAGVGALTGVAPVLGSVAASMGMGVASVGFVAGAVGSVASQLVGMATGDVQSFSWKAVGQSALASGITAGVGSALTPAANPALMAGTTGAQATGWASLDPILRGAATATASTGMNMVLHGDWSWRQMGASVVGSMAGAAAGGAVSGALGESANAQASLFAQRLAGGFAGGWASSEVMAGHNGFTRADSSVLFASAMGNAIGQGIADGPQNSAQQSFRQQEIRSQNVGAGSLEANDVWTGNGLRMGGGYGARFSEAAVQSWRDEIDGGIALSNIPQDPRTYTARAGDNPATIGRDFFGDERAGAAILAANGLSSSVKGARSLQVGQVLTMPDDISTANLRAGGGLIAADTSTRRQEAQAAAATAAATERQRWDDWQVGAWSGRSGEGGRSLVSQQGNILTGKSLVDQIPTSGYPLVPQLQSKATGYVSKALDWVDSFQTTGLGWLFRACLQRVSFLAVSRLG